jgi:hypothetical protein
MTLHVVVIERRERDPGERCHGLRQFQFLCAAILVFVNIQRTTDGPCCTCSGITMR